MGLNRSAIVKPVSPVSVDRARNFLSVSENTCIIGVAPGLFLTGRISVSRRSDMHRFYLG